MAVENRRAGGPETEGLLHVGGNDRVLRGASFHPRCSRFGDFFLGTRAETRGLGVSGDG